VKSIEDQVKILRELAASQHDEIVEVVTESKSARLPNSRPEFERIVKLVERGKADGILCWSLNRLARNPIDSAKISWLLQTEVLKAVRTPERTHVPEDNVLLMCFENGVANQFIIDLRKGVLRGIESKLAKGEYPGKAPEGYMNDPYSRTIEIDPERFPILKEAWAKLIAKTHTVADVLKFLNEDCGYRTVKRRKLGGQKLSESAVYRLFSNPFYTGSFMHNGTMYSGKHTPMVTPEEFEGVRKWIRRTRIKPHNHLNEYAYTGLVKCGNCERSITASISCGKSKRGRWVYYFCNSRKGACNTRYIREWQVEQAFESYIRRTTITAFFKAAVMEELEKWVIRELGTTRAILDSQERTLRLFEQKLEELFEMRLQKLIDDDQFRQRQAVMQQQIVRLRAQRISLAENSQRIRSTVSRFMDFRLTAYRDYLTGDVQRRKELARSLGFEYTMYNGRLRIKMNPLLALKQPAIFERVEPLKTTILSTKSDLVGRELPHGTPADNESGLVQLSNRFVRKLHRAFTMSLKNVAEVELQ
jgi:site-specific DNA recombinase